MVVSNPGPDTVPLGEGAAFDGSITLEGEVAALAGGGDPAAGVFDCGLVCVRLELTAGLALAGGLA